jgi:hypothetical protein
MHAVAIDPSLLHPDNHLGASSSAVLSPIVLGVWVALLLVAIAAFLRYQYRAARANAAVKDTPLATGEAIVLGTVELAQGEETAVRVEITQTGTESESSGSWSHSWTERDRRIRVRPFYLRHASGQRVRVEPPELVQLVDDMDGCIRVNLAERIRIAELTPGEKVFAHGALTLSVDPEHRSQSQDYRATAFGFVLRPHGGKMLLSSRPLGEPYARRARRHLGAAALFLLLTAGAFAIHGFFLLRWIAGETVEGTIDERKVVVKKDDDGTTTYHRLWIKYRKDRYIQDVSQSLYRRLAVGHRVPLRIVNVWPRVFQLGARATIHSGALITPLLPALLAFFAYTVASRRPVGWWESELEERGGGRLSESD